MTRRRLRWDNEAPGPRHPYRDSALFYALLAIMIVVITAVTDGNLLPGDTGDKAGVLRWIGRIGAIPVAAGFFVLATGFSWWRWRERLAAEEPRP